MLVVSLLIICYASRNHKHFFCTSLEFPPHNCVGRGHASICAAQDGGKIVLNKVDKLSKNGFGNNYWRIYRNPDEYFVYLPFAAREKNIRLVSMHDEF